METAQQVGKRKKEKKKKKKRSTDAIPSLSHATRAFCGAVRAVIIRLADRPSFFILRIILKEEENDPPPPTLSA
jgi:hypothetical protein